MHVEVRLELVEPLQRLPLDLIDPRVVARDEGAVGVVASPVLSPNGLVYVGSGDGYFYAVRNLTGKVAWTMRADGAVQSSAAVDESGRLYFATDNGTVYQIVEDAGSSAR